MNDAFRVGQGLHELARATGMIQVEPATFAITAIKNTEGRSSTQGLLVRGVNLSDRPITVRLRPWRDFDRIARVNLNEDFVEPLLAEADGAITLAARPWQIVTVRWEDV